MFDGVYLKLTGYHHRRSIRLPGYDYSRSGAYFVTVCIHDRKLNLFGDVTNATMVLNESGTMAQRCWRDIPNHFPYAWVDDFVVMPNHVHGIIRICDVSVGANDHSPMEPPKTTACFDTLKNHPADVLQFYHGGNNRANDHSPLQTKTDRPYGTSKTIGSIVRGFKIGVTKLIRKRIPGMSVWQRNYYEHIIRNEQEYHRIAQYIVDNPARWNIDRLNTGAGNILMESPVEYGVEPWMA